MPDLPPEEKSLIGAWSIVGSNRPEEAWQGTECGFSAEGIFTEREEPLHRVRYSYDPQSDQLVFHYTLGGGRVFHIIPLDGFERIRIGDGGTYEILQRVAEVEER